MKKLLTWFGIIGSVASIVSLLYIFIPRDENIKLEVVAIDKESLTQDYRHIEPDLLAEYRYKGEKVKNLWKYHFKIINKSNKTLIGTSAQKNILTDSLTFSLKNGYELLDFKKNHSQFSHKLSIDSTLVKIAFEQWRPLEYIEYSFYIRVNNSNPDNIPFKELGFRQIVDGDIIFKDVATDVKSKHNVLNLPSRAVQSGYVISLIFIGLFVILFTIIIVLIPFSYYKTSRWYRKNFPEFVKFINTKFATNERNKNRFIDKPTSMPDHYWKDFKGQNYPNISLDFDIKKFYVLVLVIVVFVIVDFSLIIAFSDLIRMFP